MKNVRRSIFGILAILMISMSANIVSANINTINNIKVLQSVSGEIHLKGIYYIDSVIAPTKNNIIITGDGIDSTILEFGNSINGQLYFNGITNITIRNLTLKSANGIAKSRLLFNNSNTIKLQNVKINGGGKYFLNWAVFFSTNNRNIVIDHVITVNTEDSPIRFFNKNGLYNSFIKITNYTNLGNSAGYYQYGNGDGIDLYGARDVTLDGIYIYNVGSNGIGIYADAKNIVGNNIYLNNIGGQSKGSGIAIERWNDLDPGNIQLNNVTISQDWGHGIRLLTRKSKWNKYDGKISDIKIIGYHGDKIWWSGLSLEGGSFSNIQLSDFILSNTNLGKGGSPVINFGSSNNKNVIIQNGQFVKPFKQDKIVPSGVTMRNIKGY